MVEDITAALVSSTSHTVPPIKFAKHTRPYWCPALNQAHLKAKKTYLTWRAAGKPLDPTNPLKTPYKEAKHQLGEN